MTMIAIAKLTSHAQVNPFFGRRRPKKTTAGAFFVDERSARTSKLGDILFTNAIIRTWRKSIARTTRGRVKEIIHITVSIKWCEVGILSSAMKERWTQHAVVRFTVGSWERVDFLKCRLQRTKRCFSFCWLAQVCRHRRCEMKKPDKDSLQRRCERSTPHCTQPLQRKEEGGEKKAAWQKSLLEVHKRKFSTPSEHAAHLLFSIGRDGQGWVSELSHDGVEHVSSDALKREYGDFFGKVFKSSMGE